MVSDPVLELVERGRALLPEERARLVDMLLVSLEDTAPPEVAQAWDREIARRIAAHRAGEIEAYDLEDVLAQARLLAP
jgi:putative addiction module component (TIGR02574 family)